MRQDNTLYLYYDGECPLCSQTAITIRIKQSVGRLVLIDARSNDPKITTLVSNGYDLNEGIAIEYNDTLYYKEEALQLLAMISSSITFFNKMSIFILKRKWLANSLYPLLKLIRNFILWSRKIDMISHEAYPSISKKIFGTRWEQLPIVFKKQYANRPYSEDLLSANGLMNIKIHKIFKPLFFIFRIIGFIGAGANIPVKVNFRSNKSTSYYIFERFFYSNDRNEKKFVSRLLHLHDNEVLDILPFGFAWRLKYFLEDNKIKFWHCGYVWRFLGITLPLPIFYLIGKGEGEQIAISENEFSLCVKLIHPIFGTLIEYTGIFQLQEDKT